MTDLTLPDRPPVPGRVSQATHIEQGRAAAEVFAAMQAARALPRDETTAAERMREACGRYAFASRAFYKVPRGGSNATGPSVHLLRELARIWGNVHYGLAELDRDPVGPDRDRGRSEVVAFAWDLEANVRDSVTFIVEHARDLSAQKDRATGETIRPANVDPLTTLQAVYENNANMGARRVRQTIRAVLPVWYVDEAIERCQAALVRGDGKPLAERIADTLAWFEAHMQVRPERIEGRVGKPSGRWTAHDLADLAVIGHSIRRNETTAAEEFPDRVATADDLRGGPPAEPAAVEPAAPASRAELGAAVLDLFDRLGLRPDERLAAASAVLDRKVTAAQLRNPSIEDGTALRDALLSVTTLPEGSSDRGDRVDGLIHDGAAILAQSGGGGP